MINFIICILTNLFRVYLMRKFILIFLKQDEKNNSKEIELLTYGLFFVVNTSLYLLLHLSWVNMICNLVGMYAMTCLYTRSIRTKVFITCSLYLINIGCDIVGTLLLVNYEEGQAFNEVFQIVIVFLDCICVFCAEKIVSYRQNKKDIQSLPLLLVPLSSIIMICILVYNSDVNANALILTILCIGLLIINMLIFYLYNLILKSIIDQYENEMLKQKVQIYSSQLEAILLSEERVKSLKHDLKHHLNELKLLAKKHELQDMDAYIDNMQEFIQNPNEIVASGNVEVDGVLNYMLQKANEELNTVRVKVQLPEKVVHAFDIVVILGNLLENAIEAAKKTKEKYLDVVLIYRQGVLTAEIKNSFLTTEVLVDNTIYGGYVTTKRDKKAHGIGLRSVQRIVEKYNGILDIDHQGELFCVKLMLYIHENI